MTPSTLRLLERLARAAGRSHDIGKAGSYFVNKLQQAGQGYSTGPDTARHEWVSTKALERVMLEGVSLHDALAEECKNADILLEDGMRIRVRRQSSGA